MQGMESLHEKVQRVLRDPIVVTPWNEAWAAMYLHEREHLMQCMPEGLIVNIEHFGSTAVPHLAAKPIVDMVIEVSDVEWAKRVVPEILEPKGYDCFYRPTSGNDTPPWYTWCIKRDEHGMRTHHLHFGEVGFKNAELRFRDILRSNPDIAKEYGQLKMALAQPLENDREAYTSAKTDFISKVLRPAATPE